MTRRLLCLTALLCGFLFAQNRVYELRTYTVIEGKLEALKKRFRDHTIEIFKRHGMESIGYWVPQDPEKSEDHADLHHRRTPAGKRPPRIGRSSAPIRNGRRWRRIPRRTARSWPKRRSPCSWTRPISPS